MCDMTSRLRSAVGIRYTWDPVTFLGITLLAGGADTTQSWTLRHHTVNGSTLQMDSIPCGGTSPDICSPFFSETYAQSFPDSIWDSSAMPVTSTPMTLVDPDPGDPFNGPTEVNLIGLSLTPPNAAWPATWNAAGLTWLDPDNDGQLGLTSIARNTGTSPSCGFPYANLPDQSNSNGPHIDRLPARARTWSCHHHQGLQHDPVPSTGGQRLLRWRARSCRYANSQPCNAAR
jgi:hypothetical protein